MKTLKPILSTSIGIISLGLVWGLGNTSAQAADFRTTFNLTSPGGTPQINTIVFNWSTNLTSGIVTESDLTNWSYQLLNGGSVVYSETVVSGGVVQPIGGVSRSSINFINFDFDLDTNTFNAFDNDTSSVQANSSGVTYNVFSNTGTSITINRREDGAFQNGFPSAFSSSTAQVTTPVPEPASIIGLMIPGILGLLLKKPPSKQ